MKKSKFLAVLLCVAMLATQFTMLGGVIGVSAEDTTDTTVVYEALTNREEFLMGVNIHSSANYAAYTDTYSAIHDAQSLGSNVIRINGMPATEDLYSYYNSVGDIAADKDMQVMMATVGFVNYLKITETVDEVETTRYRTVDELDLEAITNYYTELATKLKGKIKYYQLGNEMDNGFYLGSDTAGRTYEGNYSDVTVAAVAIQAATDAIHDADPDAKVVVNFSWQHVGFIHGLKTVDIDSATEGTQTASWDYIGMDCYSNIANTDFINPEDGEPYDYTDNINDLADYDEPIIICETNLTPTGWNEEDHSEVYYTGDASWLANFLTYCYASEDVAGFIAYELYDEPAYSYDSEGNEVWNKESHYGLIDNNGNKKETYNVLQALYGGTDVARVETVPTVSETELVGEVINTAFDTVYTKTISKKFGDGAIFYVDDFDAVDISGFNFIEFDMYVEDADALKTAMENAGASFQVVLYGNGNQTREVRNVPIHKIKNDGWNHIVLSAPNFSFSSNGGNPYPSVDKVTVGFYGACTSTETNYYNAVSGMTVAIANLCGTKLTRTTQSTVGTPIDNQLTPTNMVGRIGNNSGYAIDAGAYSYRVKNLTATDLSEAEYIEFDIYIDDYDALMLSLTQDADGNAISGNLYFYISEHATSCTSDYFRYDLSKHITHDGWNHIVLYYKWLDPAKSYNAAAINKSASHDRKTVASYGIRFEGGSSTVAAPAGFDMFAMTNVIATVKATPIDATLATPKATLTTAGKTAQLGAKFNYTGSNMKTTGLTATDFSTAEYLEFDFFVESYGALKKEMEAMGPTGMTLRISSNETNPNSNYIAVSFFNQVKQSGWNHIVVPRSSWNTASVTQTAIVSYIVYFNGTINDISNSQSTMYITVANIQGTSVSQPEMNNTAPITLSIIEDGMSNWTLGTNFTGNISAVKNGIDITQSNGDAPQYIEFDLFVEDYDKFIAAASANVLQLRISSAAGDNPVYANTSLTAGTVKNYITKSGWNHIQIPFSEFKKGSTSGTIDLTAITYWGLYFGGTTSNANATSGMKLAIANIAATTEIVVPNDIMKEHTAIIDEVTNITFNGDGLYTIDMSTTPVDISNDNLFEMDVFVNGTALESLTVIFIDANEATAEYTFTELVSDWNHLALRLDDFTYTEGFDKTQIISCILASEADVNIYAANFYTASYLKGDGNRDGAVDVRDIVRMKKYLVNITHLDGTVGNTVAMDTIGNDYIVNAADLTELVRYLLNDNWSEN